MSSDLAGSATVATLRADELPQDSALDPALDSSEPAAKVENAGPDTRSPKYEELLEDQPELIEDRLHVRVDGVMHVNAKPDPSDEAHTSQDDTNLETKNNVSGCRECNDDCVPLCKLPNFHCHVSVRKWMNELGHLKPDDSQGVEKVWADNLYQVLSDHLGNMPEYLEWCLTDGREWNNGEVFWERPKSWETLTKLFPVFYKQYLEKKREGKKENSVPDLSYIKTPPDTESNPDYNVGLVAVQHLDSGEKESKIPPQESAVTQDALPTPKTASQQNNAKPRSHRLIIDFNSTVKYIPKPSKPVNLVTKITAKAIDRESNSALVSRIHKLRSADHWKINSKLKKLVKNSTSSRSHMRPRTTEEMVNQLNNIQWTEVEKMVENCELLDMRGESDWSILYAVCALTEYRREEVFQIIHQHEIEDSLLHLRWTIFMVCESAEKWDPTYRTGKAPLISELQYTTKREIISYIRNTNHLSTISAVIKPKRMSNRSVAELVKNIQKLDLPRQSVINNIIARLEPGKQGIPAKEDGTGEAFVDFDTFMPSTLNAVHKFVENKSINDEQINKLTNNEDQMEYPDPDAQVVA